MDSNFERNQMISSFHEINLRTANLEVLSEPAQVVLNSIYDEMEAFCEKNYGENFYHTWLGE